MQWRNKMANDLIQTELDFWKWVLEMNYKSYYNLQKQLIIWPTIANHSFDDLVYAKEEIIEITNKIEMMQLKKLN